MEEYLQGRWGHANGNANRNDPAERNRRERRTVKEAREGWGPVHRRRLASL